MHTTYIMIQFWFIFNRYKCGYIKIKFIIILAFTVTIIGFSEAISQTKWSPTPEQLQAAPFVNHSKDILLNYNVKNRIERAEKLFEKTYRIDPMVASYIGNL